MSTSNNNDQNNGNDLSIEEEEDADIVEFYEEDNGFVMMKDIDNDNDEYEESE